MNIKKSEITSGRKREREDWKRDGKEGGRTGLAGADGKQSGGKPGIGRWRWLWLAALIGALWCSCAVGQAESGAEAKAESGAESIVKNGEAVGAGAAPGNGGESRIADEAIADMGLDTRQIATFDSRDDLYNFWLDGSNTGTIGRTSINRDPAYITQGDGSLKWEMEGVCGSLWNGECYDIANPMNGNYKVYNNTIASFTDMRKVRYLSVDCYNANAFDVTFGGWITSRIGNGYYAFGYDAVTVQPGKWGTLRMFLNGADADRYKLVTQIPITVSYSYRVAEAETELLEIGDLYYPEATVYLDNLHAVVDVGDEKAAEETDSHLYLDESRGSLLSFDCITDMQYTAAYIAGGDLSWNEREIKFGTGVSLKYNTDPAYNNGKKGSLAMRLDPVNNDCDNWFRQYTHDSTYDQLHVGVEFIGIFSDADLERLQADGYEVTLDVYNGFDYDKEVYFGWKGGEDSAAYKLEKGTWTTISLRGTGMPDPGQGDARLRLAASRVDVFETGYFYINNLRLDKMGAFTGTAEAREIGERAGEEPGEAGEREPGSGEAGKLESESKEPGKDQAGNAEPEAARINAWTSNAARTAGEYASEEYAETYSVYAIPMEQGAGYGIYDPQGNPLALWDGRFAVREPGVYTYCKVLDGEISWHKVTARDTVAPVLALSYSKKYVPVGSMVELPVVRLAESDGTKDYELTVNYDGKGIPVTGDGFLADKEGEYVIQVISIDKSGNRAERRALVTATQDPKRLNCLYEMDTVYGLEEQTTAQIGVRLQMTKEEAPDGRAAARLKLTAAKAPSDAQSMVEHMLFFRNPFHYKWKERFSGICFWVRNVSDVPYSLDFLGQELAFRADDGTSTTQLTRQMGWQKVEIRDLDRYLPEDGHSYTGMIDMEDCVGMYLGIRQIGSDFQYGEVLISSLYGMSY